MIKPIANKYYIAQNNNYLYKSTNYHSHRKIAGKSRYRNVSLWIDYKDPNQKEDGTPFRFTGKERDLETGLYYYGARYLDPKTSRWMSTDPAIGEYLPSAPVNEEAKKRNGNLPGMGGVFNYVNLHVYHYAGNNPVKFVDPTGRDFFNDSNDSMVVRSEDGKYLLVGPGEKHTGRIDGVILRDGTVVKVTNEYNEDSLVNSPSVHLAVGLDPDTKENIFVLVGSASIITNNAGDCAKQINDKIKNENHLLSGVYSPESTRNNALNTWVTGAQPLFEKENMMRGIGTVPLKFKDQLYLFFSQKQQLKNRS